jgi:tRNA nucleotidyltransferase (CCA-adding enzyme)
MFETRFCDLPPQLLRLAHACEQAGGRALLVGGGVRDRLMGIVAKDLDVEVFGLPTDALVSLLRKLGSVNEVGRSFGVYKCKIDDLEIDVSIPRRDSKFGPGHRGIAVIGDPLMSFGEASRRRDLTVNAIGYDPIQQALLDPQGGVEDLRTGRLHPVDEATFLEDPLRAVRAIQFAARLDFEVSPLLLDLCRRASLDELPAERIQGEWEKLLLNAKHPSTGFKLARAAGIIERVFPEVTPVDDPKIDRALDRLARGPRDALEQGQAWALMLGTWLHRASPAAFNATLDRLWLHRWSGYRLRERALQLAAHWQEPIETDAQLRHLSTRCELEITLLARWALLEQDVALERLERARALGISTEKPAPILLGRHLSEQGVPAGRRMGQALKATYTLQLDGTVTNLDSARKAARAWLDSNPDPLP